MNELLAKLEDEQRRMRAEIEAATPKLVVVRTVERSYADERTEGYNFRRERKKGVLVGEGWAGRAAASERIERDRAAFVALRQRLLA